MSKLKVEAYQDVWNIISEAEWDGDNTLSVNQRLLRRISPSDCNRYRQDIKELVDYLMELYVENFYGSREKAQYKINYIDLEYACFNIVGRGLTTYKNALKDLNVIRDEIADVNLEESFYNAFPVEDDYWAYNV